MVTTVLLTDDQAVERDGLQRLLEADPDIRVIATAQNGSEAIALAAQFAPDVVVMDLSVAGLNIRATRSIVRQNRAAAILLLPMHSSAETVRAAFAAGARGFVLRESAIDEVVDAVRAVSTGRVFLGDGVTRMVAAGSERR